MILKLAEDRTVSANTESMLPDRLHCTSHVEIEREPQYEEEWFNGVEHEKRFNKIFWNENVCALSACLSAKQMQLYLITEDSAPHLSLTKATEQKWAALGLFVRKCMRATEGLKREEGRNTLKYVDDLLICARDEVTCVADTVTLLNHLAREGHKVSLTKLQFVKQEITFLGHTITPNSKAISEKRIKAIKDVPRPITKKQLLSFLGMCAYCRTFIPNYAFLEKPLRALTTGKGLRSCDKTERPFTQMVDAVSMILQEQRTSHLSTARWLRYHTILLDMPNVTVKRCTTLNPATLLPTEEDGEEHHCCLSVLEQVCTPRPDLFDTPLENCDNVLFVDGSASKDPQTGLNKVGFAVTTEFEVVKSGKLPSNYSAQGAELVALTEACKLMADKCVTIYTDSRYAFGVTHDFGALWKHRNFLKSDGHPILNASLVSKLLEAILLPDKVAICKCAAHTNDKSFISTGNGRADAAAKAAAAQETKETTCALVSVTNPDISPCLQSMQTFSTGAEKQQWRSSGCSLQGGVWMSVDDIPCLPKHFFQHYAKLTHGLDHVSKGSMIMQMKELWFTKGFTVVAEIFCKRCVTCNTHNVARGIKTPLASQPAPAGPFEYLMMDFIELTPCGKQKHCLVMVDMWSKWVEAFPTSKQDSAAVAKALLTEIVPRWGIPRKISSDNGRHFVNDAIKQVGQFLGIDMRTHCRYAPSSGGAVERQNQTIKNKLAKCCEETGLTWLKALPIVLMYMRMRKRVKTNLSPFEILFGRPPFMGMEGGKQRLPSTDVCENDMLNYCKEMSCLLSNISVQVKAEGC